MCTVSNQKISAVSSQCILQTPDIHQVGFPQNVRVHFVTFAEASGLNLAGHTGAAPEQVQEARAHLQASFPKVHPIAWLTQQHTINIVNLNANKHLVDEAAFDASTTTCKKEVCAVLTADCLPLLISHKDGAQVAAVHAGWRGLADGIVEKALAAFSDLNVAVVIGPSIKQAMFEVGNDVLNAFGGQQGRYASFFVDNGIQDGQQKWLADLPGIARQKLEEQGVNQESIYVSDICTYQAEGWPSYRRNKTPLRMASLIWFE
ncbi:MAG: peptidoglycan editing factor PgeF [Pseudomonadota bacterium]|nr:peptidoglycan editing factor PgeF [Pseudomonadota bacterium]